VTAWLHAFQGGLATPDSPREVDAENVMPLGGFDIFKRHGAVDAFRRNAGVADQSVDPPPALVDQSEKRVHRGLGSDIDACGQDR
jgi:hypothetical protein